MAEKGSKNANKLSSLLLITTEAAVYWKNSCEIHIKADPAPHKIANHINANKLPCLSLILSPQLLFHYTPYGTSPFLPVCLASRPPLTIFLSLISSPLLHFSLLFLPSPLSPIPRVYLLFLSHFSGIPHRHPPLSPNRKLQSQTRKRGEAPHHGQPDGPGSPGSSGGQK